jgi:hypothetical protein
MSVQTDKVAFQIEFLLTIIERRKLLKVCDGCVMEIETFGNF